MLTLVVPVLLSGCTGTAGGGTADETERAKLAAGGLFVASIPWDNDNVDLVDVQTGQIVEKLLPNKRGRLSVAGLFVVGSSQLLVTYSTGPSCTSGVAGCGPKAHTCGGEVDEVTLATGAVKVLWRVGKDTTLAAASLNPGGTEIAALTSACVPAYFNDHIAVRSLSTGSTWSIGGGLPRCHSMTGPVWTADGRSLLTTYAAASGATPYTGGDGTCTPVGDAAVVQVAAEHAQGSLTGKAVAAAQGCTYRGIAAAGVDRWALQACGWQDGRADARLSLIGLDMQLRTTRKWELSTCDGGANALTARADSRVLVGPYRSCAGGQAQPVSVLAQLAGTTLTKSGHLPYGRTAYNFLTW